MGTSTGGGGAQGGIESVGRLLRRTRSDVLQHTVAVPLAAEAFDSRLRLVDRKVSAEVRAIVSELAVRARTEAPLAA